VVDTQLKAEAGLADLQVFRTFDRYVVLAGRPIQYREAPPHRYAVQNNGSRTQPIVEARAYGIERETAKLVWEADLPVTATLLNQPAHVPFLVFAMNVNQQSRAGSQRATTNLLCMDTRDGRVVYDESLTRPSTSVVVVADPDQKKLEIHCNAANVSLTFGDKKPEPAPDPERAADGDQKQSADDAEAAGEKRRDQPAVVPVPQVDNPSNNPFGVPSGTAK
jgi:hypothetical protein